MAAPLKLSVVIPTYNRRAVLISQTLPAMFRQDMAAGEFEIIIVVDGSTDGTVQALRELQPPCSLQIIEQPNRGPSAARNNGVQAARSELLFFVDDDIICGPHLFQQHIAAHGGSEPVVVYGPISNAPGAPPSILKNANDLWYEKYCAALDSQDQSKPFENNFLISNSSMLRSTLLDCGGFDENMTAKEDYELGIRLWQRGVRFRVMPNARAYELSVKSWQTFLFHDGKIFGQTEVRLSRKHPDYRPQSVLLTSFSRTVWWRRLPRRIVLQFPTSPVYLLTPAIWVCNKLCRIPAMQKAGLRLLEIGRRFTELRAALKEAGSWKGFQREFAATLPVLLYHHVGPAQPGTHASLTVSPTRFERHVRWLAWRGYRGICPADWLRWLNEGKGLPDKPVLFTFDDGYADLAEFALPVLRRYGFGAAVFIVTRQLGGTNALGRSTRFWNASAHDRRADLRVGLARNRVRRAQPYTCRLDHVDARTTQGRSARQQE